MSCCCCCFFAFCLYERRYKRSYLFSTVQLWNDLLSRSGVSISSTLNFGTFKNNLNLQVL